MTTYPFSEALEMMKAGKVMRPVDRTWRYEMHRYGVGQMFIRYYASPDVSANACAGLDANEILGQWEEVV